jgi:hypothetical protein
MRNTVILDRNFFQGSASKKCSTSPAMVELMKNPKIASVLFDQSRQEAFFKVMLSHVGEGGKLDENTLRAILGELYSDKNSRLSKGSIERIADALLTENRDPKYFTYPEEPETKREEKTFDVSEPAHETASPDAGTKRKTIIQRIFG